MTSRITGRRLQRRRARMRKLQPWCVHCLPEGKYRQWADLDHIVSLQAGGTDTFDNLQGLCERHHRLKTAHDLGYDATPTRGADATGSPTDEGHPWNQ